MRFPSRCVRVLLPFILFACACGERHTYTGTFRIENEEDVEELNTYIRIEEGGLRVSGSELRHLHLPNLESVDDEIFIQSNDLLESLSIPTLLTADDITLRNNDSLLDIELGSLVSVGDGGVTIEDNDSLESMGNWGVSLVYGSFSISNNALLQSLAGLNNLTEVIDGGVLLEGNLGLEDLTGLESLQSIESLLYIVNNANLERLTGLEALQSLERGLEVSNNPALSDLGALSNLVETRSQSTIPFELNISENTSLGYCEICSVAEELFPLVPTGTSIVSGNLADSCGASTVATLEQLECSP